MVNVDEYVVRLKREVGRRISDLRHARSWTQEELAERADLSTRYVQLIERGQQNLTIETLAKMARTLSVSVDELLRKQRGRATRPPPKKARR